MARAPTLSYVRVLCSKRKKDFRYHRSLCDVTDLVFKNLVLSVFGPVTKNLLTLGSC